LGQTAPAVLIAAVFSTFLPGNASAQAAAIDTHRKNTVFQFTAAQDRNAFPVPLSGDTIGILYFESISSRRSLISETKVLYLSPHISRDGQRLIFVRRPSQTKVRQLVSCQIDNWHCRIILETENTIFSPVEVRPDAILFSSSPMTIGPDKQPRHSAHDFYLIRAGQQAVRLTEFEFYQLGPLSLAGDKVIVSAIGASRKNPVIPKLDPLAPAKSDIFQFSFDEESMRVIAPSSPPLTPLHIIEGYSTHPSISPNGRWTAFLNRRSKGGVTNFNLAIADAAGDVVQYVAANGLAFSQPAALDHAIVFNTLSDKAYALREIPLANPKESREIAQFGHSQEELAKLERVTIQLRH
jgi:hypothetical protein